MRYKVLLFLIVCLGFFFRFLHIEKAPPSMYWDEVSQGYNAYSLLQTGRDEHQEFLPLARFQAFGDYKAPVYIYLDVPFIALFGKTTLGVRMPSVLFGTATIFLSYLLVCELFHKRKDKQLLGIVTAFLLAISPWHIQLSRAAYEANIATFFTILAICLLFLAKRTSGYYFLLSTISFVLAFYAFNAHRIFIPSIGLLLGILYFKEIVDKKIFLLSSIILGLVLLCPFLLYLSTPESRLRFNEVNIFSDVGIVKQSNELIASDDNSLFSRVLHNRRVLFSLLYIRHYFDFFDPSYLFISGDGNPRFSTRDTGELFFWEMPLLIVGFYVLFRHKTRSGAFILIWFLLAPVAAATARETPHALRSETFLPTYQIIGALGAVQIITLFGKVQKYIKYVVAVVSISVVGSSIYLFMHDYLVHAPITFSYEWQYGYKQAVQEAEKVKKNYEYVAFTESYGRPYIYLLFYSDITPQTFWSDSKVQKDAFGFYEVPAVGVYRFRKQLIMPEDANKKVLYVGKRNEIPLDYTVLKQINFLDGNPAFVLAERR